MEKDSITAADGDAGRFPAALDHVQPRVRRAALRLAITLGHRQVLRLGCSRLIINEPTLMKGMQETTMESMLEKEAAPTAAAIRLPIERPTGIVWAIVLIILGSLLGLFVRLTALPLTTESAPWIALHAASIVVAWGLWHLKRWAYWCLLTAVAVGIGQNLWRLLITPETFGLVYPTLRLAMFGVWGWYSWRPHVRQAFGYNQVERQVG